MDFKSLLKESHLLHYCNIYNLPDYSKFILLIESDEEGLNFKVTNGCSVYITKLQSDKEVADMQKKANTPTLSTTLQWLRQQLDNAEVSLTSSSTSATLHIGGNKLFEIDLLPSDQTSNLLFSLATLAHQLQKENNSLRMKNEKFESERLTKDSLNRSSSPSPNKKSLITGNKVAKKGMSIVNPANRKRKVAKGLKFSEDTVVDE